SQKRDTGYFNSLKADSRNVTNSMTFATKSSNQNFIVFLNKIQATIIGYKSSDFFLNPDTLPDVRIWLFGFNSYFFQHHSLGMRNATKRVGLQGNAQMSFLVLCIMPLLVLSVATELPGSRKTATLAHPAGAVGLSEREFYSK
ncbi:hypothetical protein K5549_020763, partial [Capra hircus]|uniref:Uncharacterized protein n=1 Tax=Capra hircus TaxID=9925 RepID=A0A452G4G7_CAPHI